MKYLICVPLILLLHGCVSLPKCSNVFEDTNNDARVILYFEQKLGNILHYTGVGIDDCQMSDLNSGGFLSFNLPAGNYSLNTLNDSNLVKTAIPISLVGGETKYYRCNAVVTMYAYNAASSTYSFEEVTESQARSENEAIGYYLDGTEPPKNECPEQDYWMNLCDVVNQ